jgi:diguanylate cyclase (GGDEF)-like protein/PAS domain S-box-containing protein
MTYVGNVAREAGSLALAAAQFGDGEAFTEAQLRYGLLLRQVAVARQKTESAPSTARAMAEVDRSLAAVVATMDALGAEPTRGQLQAAKEPLLRQAKAVEADAKQLFDVAEAELFDVGDEAAHLQGTYQLALLGMGMLATFVTVGLVVSLRRRAGRDLSRAYQELYAESEERALAQEQLRRSNDRFRALVNNARDVITVVDVAGRIRYQSPSVLAALGRSHEELLGSDFADLVHADDHARMRATLAGSLAAPSVPISDAWRLRVGGDVRLHEVTVCALVDDPAVGGVVLNYRDITERARLQRQLEHQANTDVLTGLPNRAHLQDALVRIAAGQEDVAVLFIDLDGFKVVNDSLGHAAGDRLLQSVARRLASGVRAEDLVARLGGDEFTVVVTGERVAQAQVLAERLIDSINEPFLVNGQVVLVGASVGIASTAEGERSPDALMRNADAAMYRAKGNGRNCWETFTTSLHDHAVGRFRMETALRRAVELDELVLHYQPVLDIASGSPSMVEALVRWRRDGHLVPPSEFIPLAEEVGLMGPIGRWVLHEACRQRVEWGLRGTCMADLAVSVNLSPRQFNDEHLVDDVATILERTGLHPRLLVLEITESVFLGDVEVSKAALVALRSMGVRVALDDFGTGYSSLSHLRDLPIDAVKLDRSFVGEMCRQERDALIIETVITLAHSMGMTTVAEGVETAEQLEALRALGCDGVQGFVVSEPVPGEALPGALATRLLPRPRRAPVRRVV